MAALLLAAPAPAAAEAARAYAGAAVTVVKARAGCFADTIAMTGTVVPREEIQVRPEREGLQIALVLAEPGDAVTAGQVLARLVPPGGPRPDAPPAAVLAPVAGIVHKTNATVGTFASAQAEPLFHIVAGGEFELLAEISTKHLPRLSPGQAAKISFAGAGELPGKVRVVAATVNAMTQLAQVRVLVSGEQPLRVGTFGRAVIVVAQRCGVAIPLSAVLHSAEGAFVAVVRDQRIETRRVVVGLLSEGEAEVREGLAEGEMVVARAGAFVREGDRVRPMLSEDAAGRK